MYAVITSGGKQYKVSEGDTVKVEKLSGEVGSKVVFDQILMLGEASSYRVGKPNVEGAQVEAEITGHNRAKKIIVFKFKQRKKYRKKYGHRQPYTELKVTRISG